MSLREAPFSDLSGLLSLLCLKAILQPTRQGNQCEGRIANAAGRVFRFPGMGWCTRPGSRASRLIESGCGAQVLLNSLKAPDTSRRNVSCLLPAVKLLLWRSAAQSLI